MPQLWVWLIFTSGGAPAALAASSTGAATNKDVVAATGMGSSMCTFCNEGASHLGK